MTRFINIGFGNIINASLIIAIVNPDAAPVKRMIQSAKENGRIVDATQGRKTKGVLVMQNEMIVLSALQPDTIARRIVSFGEQRKSEQDLKGEDLDE